MIIDVNENIKLWQEHNPIEQSFRNDSDNDGFGHNLDKLLSNKQKISIRGRWFDVLTASELVRKRNEEDGYYRVLYIQINFETGEYYIGKSNRPTWSQLKRYQGSGLKFKSKFGKHKNKYQRFFMAICKTAEETEQLEASIVTADLLDDAMCLNLVAGGGGTTKHPTEAERNKKISEHMKNSPEQYQAMLQGSVKAFQSGETAALRARNERIKATMSDEEYRRMTSDRIKNWKANNPEAYEDARRKNRESMNSDKTKKKKMIAYQMWKQENPEAYKAHQNKLKESNNTPEAKAKRKASLKKYRQENPDKHKENIAKRAQASKEKFSKEVCMIDLQSGEAIRTFPSGKEAAKWLVAEGIAKNTNCASSISAVCLRKPCTTGYGFRKKAYGYDWRFKKDLNNEKPNKHEPRFNSTIIN